MADEEGHNPSRQARARTRPDSHSQRRRSASPKREGPPRDARDRIAESQWESLSTLQWIAVLVVPAVIAIYASKDWVQVAASDWNSPDWVVRKLSLALLLTTGGVLAAWGYVTQREIRMLRGLAGTVGPKYGQTGVLTVVISAAALAGLVITANDPVFYASVFIVLKVGETWGWWYIQKGIRQGIDDAEGGGLTADQESAVRALRTYYLQRPAIPMAGTWIAFGSLAFALGLLSRTATDPGVARAELAAAFVVLIGCSIINELVFARWRRIRDRDLHEQD